MLFPVDWFAGNCTPLNETHQETDQTLKAMIEGWQNIIKGIEFNSKTQRPPAMLGTTRLDLE
jgi:hypothetical protein